ncbi:nuclear transport factor 2 family protein [Halomarina oriensis]|uniref:Ketosteroid isomerase n=1 Tax=Halomarina oriensis TaxID=671145 RepID=A0A6B0GNM7_9EURY|nr:nuclear transport factor 2 family protein [Halomarina oriensis]MWG34293.1 ketosteroid isomerase [Halomarina oriensis]
MDPSTLARSYYRAIDDAADATDDALGDLLAPAFVHDRPDRTIEGRDRFVRFMREERPATDTTHELDAVYVRDDSPSDADDSGDVREVAVRGRLLRADGSEWFGFVDVFAVADGRVTRLTTYTH